MPVNLIEYSFSKEVIKMRELIGPDGISGMVRVLAGRIDDDCAGRPVVLIGVLKGAFVFMADLSRTMKTPLEVDFICASSYGDACVSSGKVSITKDLDHDIRDRDVIIVDDIVDTGLTLNAVMAHVGGKGPKSIRVCALLNKPSRRKAECHIDYVGMDVPDGFIVGYGLDFGGRFRNLTGLHELSGEETEVK